MTKNKKIILKNFLEDVWEKGDLSTVDQYIAPAYQVFHDPHDLWEKNTLDIAGFKKRLVQSRHAFPDQKFQIIHMIEEEDKVAVVWRWTGRHKEDIPNFPATDRCLETSGITIYFFRDEKLTGHWQNTDRLGIFQQLQKNAQEFSKLMPQEVASE